MEKVEVLEEQNKGLTARVAVLEGKEDARAAEKRAEEKRAEEKRAEEKRAEEKRAAEKRAEEKRAEEKRAEEKRAAELAANQKRTADRCSELLKTHAQFPLHEAARVGDTTDVLDHFLLVLKVPIDTKDTTYYGYTPLHWAALRGHASIVAHLLTKGAEINVKDSFGDTPLRWAEQGGHKDVVALLQTKGGTV